MKKQTVVVFRNSDLDQAWYQDEVLTNANGYSDTALVEKLTGVPSHLVNKEVLEVDYEPGAPLVVTRHPALLPVLFEKFPHLRRAQVKTHVGRIDVYGRHVYGVLPVHLAALTLSYTEIVLCIPAEMRGRELTEKEVRRFFVETKTYKVLDRERWNALIDDYSYCANGRVGDHI